MYCINCNQNLPDDSTFCNKCGQKVPEISIEEITNSETSTSIEIEKKSFDLPVTKKSKKKPVLISLIIVILLGISGGYWYYNDTQKKQEAAEIQTYQNNISEAVLRIVAYSYISENITNLYSKVWSKAIKADYGIEVNGKKHMILMRL
ncbi:zinc ribbon domain-containing protein [Paenibacillus pini]|uniref:zinc ribbon domain-containing protein n=1 Tax=Paenibacillus pini TaxID=669461 RepID=UPI00068FBFB9|nr:zinc ribbon domain-containing protein [Paenibacillus pini]